MGRLEAECVIPQGQGEQQGREKAGRDSADMEMGYKASHKC